MTTQGHTCAYCGKTEGRFERDHVVPRSRGGVDTPSNLVMACHACNRAKSDRLPSEWLGEKTPPQIARIEAEVSAKIAGGIASARVKRVPSSNSRGEPCYFCGAGFKRTKAWLQLGVQELPPYKHSTIVRFNEHGGREEVGRFSYPSGHFVRSQTVAIYAHASCGPDVFYCIPLVDLETKESVLDWERHLREKVWSDNYLMLGILQTAHEFAVGMRR